MIRYYRNRIYSVAQVYFVCDRTIHLLTKFSNASLYTSLLQDRFIPWQNIDSLMSGLRYQKPINCKGSVR